MSIIRHPHIRQLDLGMLIALQKMLERRNVSAVAKEIGLSQPALSHALARMREVFGDQLLIRDRNGLVPTERGLQLEEQLRTLIPAMGELFTPTAFDPRESRQLFKIAITDHAGQILIPELLHRLSSEAPHIQTSIAVIPNRQTDSPEIEAGEFNTRLGWLRSLPPHWLRRKLLGERIVLIGAVDNPMLAPNRTLTVEEFSMLRHVAVESFRPEYPNMIDAFLLEQGIKRNIVTRVSHFSVVPWIVARTDLVATMPERLANKFEAIGLIRVVRPPVPFPDHDISLAWHPRIHSDSAHKWLRDLIVDIATGLDQSQGYSKFE